MNYYFVKYTPCMRRVVHYSHNYLPKSIFQHLACDIGICTAIDYLEAGRENKVLNLPKSEIAKIELLCWGTRHSPTDKGIIARLLVFKILPKVI